MNLVLYYNFIGFMILHLLKKVFNEKRRFNLIFLPFKKFIKILTFQLTLQTSNLQNHLGLPTFKFILKLFKL